MSSSRENFTRTKKHEKAQKSVKCKQVTFTQMPLFIRTKEHKMHKKHKKHKNVKQATFFFLDVFYANKKHENATKEIGDFLSFRYFLGAFFIFVHLLSVFVLSCACEIFS